MVSYKFAIPFSKSASQKAYYGLTFISKRLSVCVLLACTLQSLKSRIIVARFVNFHLYSTHYRMIVYIFFIKVASLASKRGTGKLQVSKNYR